MTVADLHVDDPGARDPLETADAWLATCDTVALATVVSAWGSAPVPVGGQLVVAPDRRFEGSVSGGCVEVDVVTAAVDIIADGRPQLLAFGISNERAWQSGLPCGGTIKVFVQALHAADRGTLRAVLAARAERRAIAVLTKLETGYRAVIDPASANGELGERIAAGESTCVTDNGSESFLHVVLPTVRVAIFGATHITQILAGLATRVGYDVVIADPRPAFASAARFGATPVMEEWPETAFTTLGLDPRTAVVALTHAAHLDDEALKAALRTDCLYVGALGSKKNHAMRLERLRDAGVAEDALARIHAPVGLAIGAKGPAEIAVSILAEIISVARGKTP